jgi:hypothetical protein
MRITSAGNVGIGTTTPEARFTAVGSSTIAGASNVSARFSDNTNSSLLVSHPAANGNTAIIVGNSQLGFATSTGSVTTERMRITSGGRVFVGTTTALSGAGNALLQAAQGLTDWIGAFDHTSATSGNVFGIRVRYPNAAPNGTGNDFLLAADSAATRAVIRSNGGLANYQSNNVDLSDIRTKTDISEIDSMWQKIGALEIVQYKYKDQTHDDINVGVIAQQVETVDPVWVDSDGFGDTPADGEPLKTVYTKDITFAAIKALQEAMERIETLEAKVAQLENA